jgi:hypothetical protein
MDAATAPNMALTGVTGGIRGAVCDAKTGEVLAGVTVIATSPTMQGSQTAITDEHGQYAIVDLPPSMDEPNKLPLLVASMGLLVDQLRKQDQISIVVYAGESGLVLPPTSGADKVAIRNALASLSPGGGTNGGEGIALAYAEAEAHFIRGGINRVILCTDGDFNLGITGDGDLSRLIESKRDHGVFLTVLGFGMGNLKDSTMEQLADRGNGNYAYIDSLAEARKVLVQEAGATLMTVAKDVKLQIELNPARVAGYRLIGRALRNRAVRRRGPERRGRHAQIFATRRADGRERHRRAAHREGPLQGARWRRLEADLASRARSSDRARRHDE